MTKEELSQFIESLSLRPDVEVSSSLQDNIQEVTDNSFVYSNKVYPLPLLDDDGVLLLSSSTNAPWHKVEVYATDAAYYFNGVPKPVPATRIYQMES